RVIQLASVAIIFFSGCASLYAASGERMCKFLPRCRAMYGPSTCGPMPEHICTADEVYKACTMISDEEIAEFREREEQCGKVAGGKFDGTCVCPDARTQLERLVDGEMRYVVRASEAGIRMLDGGTLDQGVVFSPSGNPQCLPERIICELNGGR